MTYWLRRSSSRSTASRMNCARPYVLTSASIRAITSGARRTGTRVRFSGGRPMRRPISGSGVTFNKTAPFSVAFLNGAFYINGTH